MGTMSSANRKELPQAVRTVLLVSQPSDVAPGGEEMKGSTALTLGLGSLAPAVALGWIVASSAPAMPATTASPAFWKIWGDGKAELSGYAVTTSRYGAPREGRVVLIYVTEPMDRRNWIKDDADDVPAQERVNVLKMNHVLKFQTGIYPYSVMTSVFAPVDGLSAERFAPAKIAMSAQEWCGHVYQKVITRPEAFQSELRSYFHAEGDRDSTVKISPGTLYEDALLIQLRELDGQFAGGRNWAGSIVPSLWSQRKRHAALEPLAATIRREDATRDGAPVTRFTLTYGSVSTSYEVEKAAPRRVLFWKSSDGDEAKLLKTARLPYWKLNGPGDEKYLQHLGF
jgi:hypothetical protein